MLWTFTSVATKTGRAVLRSLGYDAVDATSGKRKAPTGLTGSEDDELNAEKRKKLVSQSRDLHRNLSLFGWGIRRHLDYVTTFRFQPQTGDKALDRQLSTFVDWWSEPDNFDIAGINSLPDFIRLAELRRMIDGDMGLLKISTGHVQAIEGDRIRTPWQTAEPAAGVPPTVWRHGVEVNSYGRHLKYAIHRRGVSTDWGQVSGGLMEFERAVPASQLLFFAHRDRFDQVRGITPLAPAINAAIDCYEGIDYALAKLKVSQLLTLAIYRGGPDALPDPDVTTDYSKFPFGKRPTVLDLKVGEQAKFLESNTPGRETQAFLEMQFQLVLKAMDIPYSFFKENFSNYSGSRQALVMYNVSAHIKRQQILWLLNALTRWRITLAVIDRKLPPAALNAYWRWAPNGIPWIDPEKEARANAANLANGTTSRIRICQANGEDFEEIMAERAKEQEIAESYGVKLDAAAAPQLLGPPEKPEPPDGQQLPDDDEGDPQPADKKESDDDDE